MSNTQEIDRTLRIAYCEALKAQHGTARVFIHLGSEVIEYLKGLHPKADQIRPGEARFYGFPLVEEKDGPPTHVSVRTVSTIA